MFDFSIELQAENIYNKKTRDYFQEVLSSFVNGNYRSALVMLWTVTIADLVFKLQDLENIYNDATARKILKEIKKQQDDNPSSPAWESSLIELIKNRNLPLFELYELTHVEALQKQRHLSAHPIIKDDVELYQPNKETVRALIRNIMESVLVKAPYASNKVFDLLIVDVAAKRDLFPDYNKLVSYVETAYLKATPLPVVRSIFKKLWKFVFLLEDDEASLNREINTRVLGVITNKYLSEIAVLIKNESDYFSRNLVLSNSAIMDFFVEYCCAYPEVYQAISSPYNAPIKEKIVSDNKLHSFSPFIYSSVTEVIESIEEAIEYSVFCKQNHAAVVMYEYLMTHTGADMLLDSYIRAFSDSPSYDDADARYKNLIKPFLNNFTKEQFSKIVEAVEGNDQIYSRRMASSANNEIKRAIEDRDFVVDFSEYNNFNV